MTLLKSVGVDLGGTKLEAGLVSEKGTVLRKARHVTPKKQGEILKKLVSIVKEVKGSEEIAGIGVGFAGFVDSRKGIVTRSPNAPAIKNAHVKAVLEKAFKCSVVVENDANMFALGEWFYGFKKKYKNIVALTIGTGVGSGVIANSKLLKGKGIACEFGHTIIAANSGKKCMCGNTGCFEAMVSGRALVERAKENGVKAENAEKIALLSSKGNKAAVRAVKETARYLGIGLANAANTFDPEAIIIGGGLSNIDLLVREAKKEMKKHVIEKNRTRVFREKLKGNAILAGAALCALNGFHLAEKRPLLAVDCIIEKGKGIVLVKRRFKPRGWALPGGIVEYNESLERAARREALEETGLTLYNLKQFHAYSKPGRDPRQHTVSVVFTARGKGTLKTDNESEKAMVFGSENLPRLVFDHGKILKDWLKEFKSRKHAFRPHNRKPKSLKH